MRFNNSKCFGLVVSALAAIFVSSGAAIAETRTFTPQFTAKVIYVDDGDTVAVLGANNSKVKIRLANIDAPESEHGRCRPSQPWSAQSTSYLKSMVNGKILAFQCSTLDRYGRHVCDIVFADGSTANQAMVKAGLAWANRANPSYLKDRAVADAERIAQSAHVGLWSEKSPVPPWQWRKSEWGQSAGCAATNGEGNGY